MTFANLVKQKRAHAIKLVNELSLSKANKSLWYVKIEDKKVLKKLLKWLSHISTNFIVLTNESFDVTSDNIVFIQDGWELDCAADFIICDDSLWGVSECFEKAIAPIVVKWSSMESLLSQFDPMRSQWNAYFYEELNEWSIFATLIRYLENYKFTFDNKNLVKNIFES